MLGGNDSVSGMPLHDAWFRAIGNDWSYLPDVTIDTLLAATYSFADGKLYVLDHSTASGADVARLQRYDMRAGRLELLGSWTRASYFTRHALLVDTDGTVLLVSSNASLSVVGRLAVDGTGFAYASQVDVNKPGNLAFDPVVDPGGYAFVVVDRDNHWITTRFATLAYGGIGHYPLGSQFFGPIVNGGFESGDLSGWTTLAGAAVAVVSSAKHSGTYGAMLGLATPTNGDTTMSQTFAVPSTGGTLTFWYENICPDTVTYDWFTASLQNTSGTTLATLVPRICTASGTWTQVSYNLAAYAGQTVVLVTTNHDDNYPGDPTFSVVDDATVN